MHKNKKIDPPNLVIRRSVQYREVIQELNTNNTLVKSFACEEFYDDCSTKVLQKCNSTSYFKTRKSAKDSIEDFKSNIPMEIDSSTDNLKDESASHKLKHYYTQKRSDPSLLFTYRQLKFTGWMKLLVILLVFLVGSKVYFATTYADIQIDKLKRDLREKVLNQTDAIITIANNLERRHLWAEKSKIIAFVGGTGVGKTFTSNLVKTCLLPHLVHEIKGNQIANVNKQDSIIEDIDSCCYNLVIIDDLYSSDITNFLNFVDRLPMTTHNLIIIPIFNIQNNQLELNSEIDLHSFQYLKRSFVESGLYFDIALFDTIDAETIKLWLKKELYRRNVPENKHGDIIETLVNEKYAQLQGFKGINGKLALLLDH